MRKTAAKMLILGVAVLTLLGAASIIKNSYAKSEVSSENLVQLNSEVEDWFERARAALEEAGVPHSEAEDKNATALGESVSLPEKSVNLGPWVVIVLGLAGGASLVFVAFSRQYQMAERGDSVSEAVDKIVAKSSSRAASKTKAAKTGRSKRRMQQAKMTEQDDEFDDIARAVDEIVAKYQQKD